ncbi:MAG TPA: 30S ribosomal protein S4 [Candidatus Hydrothermia bacterium]|nr:30S ribosomal protein S4 [Candidatus Hydrothermae bacterium]MDD3648951.1 30S ribosomal protein S4 [Candidatus Hydrothermia bacterium]HOK23192.1 30S ribosomal protein S4 [Candidatus Hydrothermia bacterium]HOL23896.1 30S ribosomal protein S4 [Candidatus Hydrothermia bacterium]HOP31847.1 30S ribosomal protein S4 [Candidatus Hydrothermia bacterium]
MARYTSSKCRLCRREGMKLFLRGDRCKTNKCALERRKSVPGSAPSMMRRKLSIYGVQLREKQKVKRMYGVFESQFRRFFEMARKMPGNTGENLLTLLERRLDNVCYLLGFAKSRSQARQLVRHGHVFLNGRKVNIPSYLVNVNDIIEVRETSREIPFVVESVEERNAFDVPTWLEFDKEHFRGRVVRLPERSDVTFPINETLIVELYSK